MRSLVRLFSPALLLWLVLCEPDAGPALNSSDWLHVSEGARMLGAAVVRDYSGALDIVSRTAISEALAEFDQASRLRWLAGSRRTSLTMDEIREQLAEADRRFEGATRKMASALGSVPGLIELNGTSMGAISKQVELPFRSGVLVLRREQHGGTAPQFLRRRIELGGDEAIPVALPEKDSFFCALELRNAPPGRSRVRLNLAAGLGSPRALDLSVWVPPQFPVRVEIHGEDGRPTEAAVALYAPTGEFQVPPTALDFSAAGYHYDPVRYRHHANARFWPGKAEHARCFFVRGQFDIELPAGSYRLIAAKGPEFVPVDRTLAVSADRGNVEKLQLQRWIDMSARGWHSGDCHIHYARPDPSANRRLIVWTQAEDLRMGNILRMGDARETYFEQYAFGWPGRFIFDRGAFVPGQEDPRTGVLGHTISLNIPRPIRDAERSYYLYSNVFDEARSQGGLSGYAHVNSDSFLVHRGMTLDVARNKVDFAEIGEFGDVNTDLYYEFLNLGFRLTAVAGSDAPWGGTVGDSRVYVYTGRQFNPDEWFEALRDGRTFVTSGPMLDFTVNDQPPGARLSIPSRQMIKIHAGARNGYSKEPVTDLEIVANGEVLRSVKFVNDSATLDIEVQAKTSMWIAARTTGAHTSPVYVTVDGKRHWKRGDVSELLSRRQRQLDQIRKLVENNGDLIGTGRQPEWENPNAFLHGREQLKRMIGEAQTAYELLAEELARDTGASR